MHVKLLCNNFGILSFATKQGSKKAATERAFAYFSRAARANARLSGGTAASTTWRLPSPAI